MPSQNVSFPRFAFISDPSPEQIRADLLLLLSNIKDYNKPLQLSKQYLIEDVKEAFATETDPITGQRWPALSQRAAREPHVGGLMLQRSRTNRKMYRAVTNKNHWGVSRRGVFLNQGRVLQIAPYTVYHQQDDSAGAVAPKIMKPSKEAILNRARENVLKRRRARETPKTAKEEVSIASRELTSEYTKAGVFEATGAGQIPQRRFIGPSPYTAGLTEKAFDEWADGAIRIYRRGNRMIKAKKPVL